MKNKAFTLAEVLITLGIIGVIAALTIPSLLSSYRKHVVMTTFKKTYSVMNQAFKRSTVDNGEYINWSKDAEVVDTNAYFRTYWQPYLKEARLCVSAISCGYASNTPWKHASGGNWAQWSVITSHSRILFRFGDGTVVFQPIYSNNADGPAYTNLIMIDINGSQGPNIIGHDAFMFYLGNAGLMPSKSACTATTSTGCANKIIQDGWQFKDDYPIKF